MKKQSSGQSGAARVAPHCWPDSKQRLVLGPRIVLVLALGNLVATSDAYAQASKLVSIASRLQCQTGDAVAVSEFIIQGGPPKHVVVRAIGPSLNLSGVSGAMSDPTMELRDSAGTLIGANDNWRDSQEAQIQATGLAPSDNRESAIDATLAPGMYTTVIRGAGNTTGVASSEVYDVDASNSSITALGTRGFLGTGDLALISGVVLAGGQNQDVLVRALGPSLANSGLSGAVANTTLELRDSNGALLAANDDWATSQGTAIQNSGLAPPSNLESAIIGTLPPGSYTAIPRGANGSAGLGFVQFYSLPYSGSPLNPAPSLPSAPVITSPLGASATAGQLFTYQFEANGATSFAVSNPPPGLAFDNTLRAIVGNPTAAGTFQSGLSATNATGTTNATLTITVQPLPSSGPAIISGTAATGRTGSAFTFQVITTGGTSDARLSASGLPAGLVVDAMTGLISGTPTSDGSFAVTLTVTEGGVTTSASLQLTFSSDPGLPVIISANSASLTPGQPFSYTIQAPSNASDPTFFTLIGTLPTGLGFDPQTGIISGTFTASFARKPASPDRIDLSGGVITNVQLFATNSNGTTTIPFIFYLEPTGAVNISTRLAVDTGDDVLIAGFIITGNAPKKVIIRALGPSLAEFGIVDALPDTTLELHEGEPLLARNYDWRDTQEEEILATGVHPRNDQESAIIATLNPGGYTAIVRGNNDTTTGTAVVEVYDLGTASLDVSSNSKLANISTRGKVLTGDHVMFGGFIIRGKATRMIVRAIGPSLAAFGISEPLQDPFLELHNDQGAMTVYNDNWKLREDGSSQQAEIEETMVAPTRDLESAIVATLSSGNYTAIVRGKKDDTAGEATIGVALVEVYVLPERSLEVFRK